MKIIRAFYTAFSRSYSNNVLQTQRKAVKLIPDETFEYFKVCLPHILNEVSKRNYIQSSGIADHIKKITNYNVTCGKHLRSCLTLHSYLCLAGPNVKEQTLYQACVLAWATDMVHACFIIADDIEDEASTRRSKPCWHLMPNVGMRAINDIMLIRDLINEILYATFDDQAVVNNVMPLFNKAFLLTAIGQHLDHAASQIVDRNYSHFTMENYDKIIKYKTTYYSIQLPILLGIYLADKSHLNCQQYVENTCMDLARLYQMQDDYYDCFRDENRDFGKSRTDIQNAKCTWLAVTALPRCSHPERIVFKTCYGSPEIAHIERIQQLYKKLQLPKTYKDEEKALHDRITQKVVASKDVLPPKIFLDYLNVIYNREM